MAAACVPQDGAGLALERIQLLFGMAAAKGNLAFASHATAPAPITPLHMQLFDDAFELLAQGMRLALLDEGHAVHVYNGSVNIYDIAHFLLRNRLAHAAIKWFLWCIFAVENSLPLMTPAFMTWRCLLYIAASICYDELVCVAQSVELLQRAAARVDELSAIERATGDLTPKTAELLLECRTRLRTAMFRNAVIVGILKTPKDTKSTKPGAELVPINVQNARAFAEKQLSKLFGADVEPQLRAVMEAVVAHNDRLFQAQLVGAPTRPLTADDVHALNVHWDACMSPALVLLGRDLILRQAQTAASASITPEQIIRFLSAAVINKQWDVFGAIHSKLIFTTGANGEEHVFTHTEGETAVVPDKKGLARQTSRNEISDVPGPSRVLIAGAKTPLVAFMLELTRMMASLSQERGAARVFAPMPYHQDEAKTTFSIPPKARNSFPAEVLPMEALLRQLLTWGLSHALAAVLTGRRRGDGGCGP